MNGKKARGIRKNLEKQGIYYDNTSYELLNPSTKQGSNDTIGLTNTCGRYQYLQDKRIYKEQ